MANPIWIVLSNGVPVEAQFFAARGMGTPIIIDTTTSIAYYMDDAGNIDPLGGSAVGITDHGGLTGLADDDHTQYHNDARGDARYAPIAHVGSGGDTEHDLVTSSVAGFMAPADKVFLDDLVDTRWTWITLGTDFSTSLTTPQDSALAFTPSASKSYCVEGQISVETNSVSSGPVLTLDFPTGVTRGMISIKMPVSPSRKIEYHGTTDDPAELDGTGMVINSAFPAFIQVFFTTGATPIGDFTVQLSAGDTVGIPVEAFVVPISDQTTALTTGQKMEWRAPYPFTLVEVRASVNTAQASGSVLTFDIKESGTSILSTKITIDNTEKTSVTAVTPAVISDPDIADDAIYTFHIDQVGASGAKGAVITLIGYQ